jgi:hypothetical protein
MTPSDAQRVIDEVDEKTLERLSCHESAMPIVKAIADLSNAAIVAYIPDEAGKKKFMDAIMMAEKKAVERYNLCSTPFEILPGLILNPLPENWGERLGQAHNIIEHIGYLMHRAEETLSREEPDLLADLDRLKLSLDTILKPRSRVGAASHEGQACASQQAGRSTP